MLVVIRWCAVILAATGILFALRWPRRLPFRTTALLGGLAALAIAGAPLAFGHGSVPMIAGTALGVGLVVASGWTVFHAARGLE
jgi:hypothetical protein